MREAAVGVVAVLALAGCAGKGADWEGSVAPVIERSCVQCHDRERFDELVRRTCAATIPDDDPAFAPARFKAEYVQGTDDPAEAGPLHLELCGAPGGPGAKARVLYGLDALRELLAEPTPPDYASAESFEDFVVLAHEGSYEGCEMLDFLAKGDEGSPEGMPPLWAGRLMEILGEQFTEPTNADRAAVRDYTEWLLPLGAGSCTGGAGGS